MARAPRGFAKHHKWLLVLLVVALGCAAMTAYRLGNYRAFAAGNQGLPFYAPWVWALGLLLVAAPLLWIAAIAMPAPETLVALRAHAAFYTVLLTITYVVDSPGHSSPGEAFASAIRFILILVFGVEALVAAVGWARLKRSLLGKKAPPFVYVGLTSALLGGWFGGVLVWSTLMPPRVIAAAESAARDRPYCIDL